MMEKREPDLLGIGVMKGGSSWIWKQLKAHPQIGVPRKDRKIVKELHFIDRLNMTLRDYNRMFGKLKTFKTVEFTPNYMCCPYAPAFIKTHFPNTKLLTILRNPVDRAFSHFKDHRYYKKIPKKVPFLKAFHEDYPKVDLPCYSIKSKGMYADQLELWFKYFNVDQLKIMLYDDLVDNPLAFLKQVYKWVGVESDWVPPKYGDKVVKSYNIAYDGMKFGDEERDEVSLYYKDQINNLESIIGRKLKWIKE